MCNSPRNGPESAKTMSADDRYVSAPQGFLIVEITPGPQKFSQIRPKLRKSIGYPKTVSNSPQNGQESAKTVSVDERHVNAPRGSLIVEITRDPKKESNGQRNGAEWARTVSVDGKHVNAPQGSLIVEVTPRPQNNE